MCCRGGLAPRRVAARRSARHGLCGRRQGGRGSGDGRRAGLGRGLALAGRSRRALGSLRGDAGAAGLGRACDSLVEGPVEDRRRQALWTLGVAVPGTSVQDGTQLALPLEPHDGPELRALSAWERMLADYGSTGVTLREHPLELMRPGLPGTFGRARSSRATRMAGACASRVSWSPASGLPRPRASCSCCWRTSTGRST